mgnify:CR=1 FL=1
MSSISQAHPRSRGEHQYSGHCRLTRFGSSPLARGTCQLNKRHDILLRLIPARAGNIFLAASLWRRTAAHPRSRGEHDGSTISWCGRFGSSPLARGTSRHGTHLRGVQRLIPARAGNMGLRPARSRICSAHPRSRGEHTTGMCAIFALSGSSPLARGTCRRSPHLPAAGRLIPARAGNILADMGVYPLHQQNRITLKPEPHPGYTINSHS